MPTDQGGCARKVSGPAAARTAPDPARTCMRGPNVPNGICAARDCTNEGPLTRGHCEPCYKWSWRNGGADPTGRPRKRNNGEILQLLRAAAETTSGECVILTGHADRPTAHLNGKKMNASRAVWVLAHGDPGEAHVLHTCHRGDDGCINLRHLKLGDNDQNIRDMIGADRHSRGTRRWSAKLDDATVQKMRDRYAQGGISYAALGALFSVSESTAHRVVSRAGWKHL